MRKTRNREPIPARTRRERMPHFVCYNLASYSSHLCIPWKPGRYQKILSYSRLMESLIVETLKSLIYLGSVFIALHCPRFNWCNSSPLSNKFSSLPPLFSMEFQCGWQCPSFLFFSFFFFSKLSIENVLHFLKFLLT